jgi:hypothetical protein
MLLDTPTPGSNRRLTVVPLQFWTDYEPDPDAPGQMRAVDWVKWGKRGDMSMMVVDKISRVRKPMKSINDDGQEEPNPVWVAIEGAYEAWKKGQEAPADGTPLEAWSALSKAQAKAFKDAGFAAVEHIALIEDAQIGKVRLPDVRRIRDLARAYVAHRENAAPVEAALAAQAGEIDELKAQLAEATAALRRLADEPEKRGPGRPRKVPEEV